MGTYLHMHVTKHLRFLPYIGIIFITCTKAKLCFQIAIINSFPIYDTSP